MSLRRSVSTVAATGLVLACSGHVEDNVTDPVASAEQAIVGPSFVGGPNQVVMVYGLVETSAGLETRICSGSYYAPRVVLAAAHCLDDIFMGQLFVYHGDDFVTDFAELVPRGVTLVPPPPGEPSSWAQADSWEAHPEWDPELFYPDMGVIYLDRRLPFRPLPLAEFRLDGRWEGLQATISGWGSNQASSPTSGEGSAVQRTGVTRVLGSPTEADYHADDPNPGMLLAHVRDDVIKTDGQPPHANTCFGDSGAPLLAKVWGIDFIAGVSYFMGLSCEDYGLHTRIDPFLPFLRQAAEKGGERGLIPHLECVAPDPQGRWMAYFGYTNENGVSLTVPYGCKNRLEHDVNGWRPARFLPGEHHFAFGVEFAPEQVVTYTLDPRNSPRIVLHATSQSPLCPEDVASEVECGAFCRANLLSGCPGLPAFSSCMEECLSSTASIEAFAPECVPQSSALTRCFAGTPPGTDNWSCLDGALPLALPCESVAYELYACLGL